MKPLISVLQNFVDLAGSEKAGENTGDRFREGCSINKSLFTLARIIAKLSEGVRYSIVSLVYITYKIDCQYLNLRALFGYYMY